MAVVLLASLEHVSPALAQQAAAPSPSIAVEGRASADLVPDVALLRLGVTFDSPTAIGATTAVAKTAQAVVAGLQPDGIDASNATTGSISLSALPVDETRNRPRKPGGFRAAATLTITIRPAERAGLIASHLVDRGANQIDGVEYLSSKAAETLDGLRAEAIRDARRKADIYVAALGVHLGRVLDIVPADRDAEPIPAPMRAASRPAPPPVLPTRPDALTLSTSVSVRWEIAQ